MARNLKGFLILLFCNFFWIGNGYCQYFEQVPSEIFTDRQSGSSENGGRAPFSQTDDSFNIFGKSGNILHAPSVGGDPISGVAPVGDGIWFLLFLVISYGLFRSFFSKKQVIIKFNLKIADDGGDHINMYTDNDVVYVSNSTGKPIQAVEIINLQEQKLVSRTN